MKTGPDQENFNSKRGVVRYGRGTQTRKAIQQVAAQLFASKGFSAVGVRDIAAAAGVNQAMVSYYFGSKGALYDEILSEAVEHAAALANGMDLDAGAPDAERRLVRIFAEAMTSRPHLVPMVLREQLDPDRLLDPGANQRLMGFMALTERVLKAIPLRSGARRYDPQIVHLICVGPLIQYVVARTVRETTAQALRGQLSSPTIEDVVETLGDMLSHALREHSSMN